jgi:hypothetical protein
MWAATSDADDRRVIGSYQLAQDRMSARQSAAAAHRNVPRADGADGADLRHLGPVRRRPLRRRPTETVVVTCLVVAEQ